MKKHYTLSGLLLCLMALFTLGASAAPDKNYLCFTANEDAATVMLGKVGSPNAVAIQYSTDGTNWNDYAIGTNAITTTTIALTNAGDKVYFRNAADEVTGFSKSTSAYYKFTVSKSVAASGNVMSLVDKSCQATTIPCNYCFYNLFNGCKALTKAPELPATTLTTYCYKSMFNGCTSLASAPELPATTLADYCYQQMFNGCTSLTTAPATLPATTLANNCYQAMFSGCKALTKAPELPATTLATSCYQNMFTQCTSLTTAPELPATTLTTSCYMGMFSNCQKLADLKVAIAAWDPELATSGWVGFGIITSGTFTCPVGLDTTSPGNNKNPSSWTVKNAYDLTVSGAWASLCVNLPLQVPEGVEVYYASAASNNTITLTKIDANTVMAAKTAVIVKKPAEGTTVSFPIASAAGTSYDNLFQGSSVAKACNAREHYVLNAKESGDDNVRFSLYTGTTLGAHKIWLPQSAVGGASSIQFRFGDATAVTAVETEMAEDVIYNLAGQRVGSDYRGLVIKNGKKMWNK